MTRSTLTARLAGLVALLTLGAVQAQELAVPEKALVCMACHGPGGQSIQPLTPHLAGQSARYIYLQLRDIQEGRRINPLMTAIVAGLTRDDMREIGEFFAAQKPAQQTFKADPAKAQLGKTKTDEALCTMCHLGGFAGQNEVPRLAGQHFDYVVKELKDFKAHVRTNDAGTMTSVVDTLSDTDIDNIAHYLAEL